MVLPLNSDSLLFANLIFFKELYEATVSWHLPHHVVMVLLMELVNYQMSSMDSLQSVSACSE
jgi:hypothetical protein